MNIALAGRTEFALLCDELDLYIKNIPQTCHKAEDLYMLDKVSDAIRHFSTTGVGAAHMLREAAKQFRQLGDDGHAKMCDIHADEVLGT